MDAASPASVQATFCATLVDEWVRAGVTHAVVAPGSRSTPLAVALTAEPRLRVEVFHDERAAGFAALGVGLATGRPAVVLCTSGTAATHLHAAVVEADLACVPLIACTADRPPELRDAGAPQTIDQTHLYGRSPRWFAEPGVPDAAAAATWRALAARAVVAATGARPGPVHLNLAFREPLLGAAGALPPGRDGAAPWITAMASSAPTVGVELPDAERLLVVGDPDRTIDGWPVLADVRARAGVAHADPILRDESAAAALVPDVIVRVGRPPASRVVNEWLARSGADEWVVADRWSDPAATASRMLPAATPLVFPPSDGAYRRAWHDVDAAAAGAIGATLDAVPSVSEPAAARAVVAALPPGAQLVLASSMPVRDVEWFAPRRADLAVHVNRGANGIDGTIGTAIGVAIATAAPTAALMGDVAFLHDSTALVGVRARGIDLTLVVVDNDGGGIFSFLPQAGALPAERFEALFGTPHGVKPEELAAAHGLISLTVDDPTAIVPAVQASIATGGVRLVVVRTDRAANVAVHDELHRAVAKALRS